MKKSGGKQSTKKLIITLLVIVIIILIILLILKIVKEKFIYDGQCNKQTKDSQGRIINTCDTLYGQNCQPDNFPGVCSTNPNKHNSCVPLKECSNWPPKKGLTSTGHGHSHSHLHSHSHSHSHLHSDSDSDDE